MTGVLGKYFYYLGLGNKTGEEETLTDKGSIQTMDQAVDSKRKNETN